MFRNDVSGPVFGFDLMSESSNETFNTSLDLAMFGDVGVSSGLF